MSKLVLVNHWSEGISNNKPPLGLGYLSSYLKRYLDFHDIAIVNTGDKTLEKIRQEKPEVVGFSAYSANYPDVCVLMRKTKEQLEVPILIGGPHITCLPHRLSEWADVGVIGEGEETLLELMRLYLDQGSFKPSELRNIKGLSFHENGEVRITPPREQITPLDRIPFPDRELLDIERFLKPSQILMNNEYIRGTTVLTSRGCPFKCIYCQVPAKWGKVRLHSAQRVVDEIEMLVKTYGTRGIYIEDDLFSSSLKRIEDIISGLKKTGVLGEVRFFLDLRANLVTDKLMALLREMGVVKVALGVESGSNRILRYLKGENITVDDCRAAVKTANKHGIGCHCCFMLGAPPETKQDIVLTQQLIKEILDMDLRNFCQVSVTTPLPGTKLWDYAAQKGYVSEDADWRQFSLNPRLSHGRDFYVNEHIEFDEFLKIVEKTTKLCNSRRLESIFSRLSGGYIKKAVSNPRLAFEIGRDYLRYRGKH